MVCLIQRLLYDEVPKQSFYFEHLHEERGKLGQTHFFKYWSLVFPYDKFNKKFS